MNDGLEQRHGQNSAVVLAAGCAVCLLLVGCGERMPETVPVGGKVLWKDKPLGDGTVMFHPHNIEEGRPKRPATGKLQADGSFVLTTFRHADGAVPGAYRVTIHSYASDPAASNDDQRPGEYRWRIPEHYGDPSHSGLVADIDRTAGTLQSFAFELEGDAPK